MVSTAKVAAARRRGMRAAVEMPAAAPTVEATASSAAVGTATAPTMPTTAMLRKG
jgi:hypothetical protein